MPANISFFEILIKITIYKKEFSVVDVRAKVRFGESPEEAKMQLKLPSIAPALDSALLISTGHECVIPTLSLSSIPLRNFDFEYYASCDP